MATEESAAPNGAAKTAPAPRRVLAGAIVSGLAAAGMGVAILVQEPEYERAAAFALAGAALYGIATAVLRRVVVAGLVLLEALTLLAFVSGVLVLRSQHPLLLFVVGLSGSLLAFMVAQIVLMAWSQGARTARSGAAGVVPRLWRAFVIALVLVGSGSLMLPAFSHVPPYESYVISDMRSLVSGQSVYASANEGLYGRPECLPEPARCLAGYSGPAFLDPQVLAPTRHRYERTFHAGPERQAASGARGFEWYAYVAVPLRRRGPTVRAFCVDDSGAVREDREGRPPMLVNGRCPTSMPLIR
jgi:hypothetical protein